MRKIKQIVGLIPLIALVATVGCNNFENPVRWDESPKEKQLVGVWETVNGTEDPFRASIKSSVEEPLSFELTFLQDTKSMFDSDISVHRATFLADLVSSSNVELLQIHMDSFAEFEADGTEIEGTLGGYWFGHVTLDENTATLRYLDVQAMAAAAESALDGSGHSMHANEFLNCLSTDLLSGALWTFMKDKDLAALAKILGESEDSVADAESAIEEFEKLVVDPYKELAKIKKCIARKLPSEYLEQVFQNSADEVFVGKVAQLNRI